MRPTTLVLALCFFPTGGLLIPLASLEAQLQPGQRVRITAPHLGISKHSGTLVAVDGDTLTLDTLQVALMNVTRLDVYMGRKGHADTGTLVGALVVGVPLAILLAVACEDVSGFCNVAGGVAAGLLVGGAVGALVGATVGALIKTDRWEEVPLDALRVSVAPQRDGRFGLGASVRF